MSDEQKSLPEYEELAEDDGGIHRLGGPDALSAGAWGTYEPMMAELELYLGDLRYPVDKAELVDHVRQQQAPEFMVITLEQLPEQQFDSAAHIMRGLNKVE